MFNTKKIKELTDQLHQLSTQHTTLRDRFNSYIEKTKPAAKFKLFDEVTATYYIWCGIEERTAVGKVTKITYDSDSLEYEYEVTDSSSVFSYVWTFMESSIKLDESKYIQFSVDPTRWGTDHIDIGYVSPNTKLKKNPTKKAKR